ncbi:MAG: Hpt domain-containing protein [Vicingaceae bacterium]
MSTSKRNTEIKSIDSQLDEETLKQILPTYFEEIKNDANQLNLCCKAKQYEMGQELTHKMKGASKCFGFTQISRLLAKLQQACGNEEGNKVKRQLNQLSVEINKAAQLVEQQLGIKITI